MLRCERKDPSAILFFLRESIYLKFHRTPGMEYQTTNAAYHVITPLNVSDMDGPCCTRIETWSGLQS